MMTLKEINEIEYFNGYDNIALFCTGGCCYEIFAKLSENLWFMGDCLDGGLFIDCDPKQATNECECYFEEWQHEHMVYMPTDTECNEIIYNLLNFFRNNYIFDCDREQDDENGIIDYENCSFDTLEIDNIIKILWERLNMKIETRKQATGDFRDTDDGIKFESRTGRNYALLEGCTIVSSYNQHIGKSSKTSDIFFVVFDDSNESVNDYVVGGLYGASCLENWQGQQEYLHAIDSMVNAYERKNFNVPNFDRYEIDLGGPTDCLFNWFLKKAQADQYRNRDCGDIPWQAWSICTTLGEIAKRVNENDGNGYCHFYLYVSCDDTVCDDDKMYYWNIVDTFDELAAHKNDGIEFYEIIVADDPYLYEIKF